MEKARHRMGHDHLHWCSCLWRWEKGEFDSDSAQSNVDDTITTTVRVAVVSGSPRIFDPLAIHNETIFVAARRQIDVHAPLTVARAVQFRSRFPVIKTTGKTYRTGARTSERKPDRFACRPGAACLGLRRHACDVCGFLGGGLASSRLSCCPIL